MTALPERPRTGAPSAPPLPLATPLQAGTLLGRRAAHARELMAAEGLDGLLVASRGHITQYGGVEFFTGYTPVARMAYAVMARSGRGPVLVVPTPADRWYAGRLPHPPEIVQVGTGDVGSRSDLTEAAGDVLAQEGIESGRVGVTGMHSVLPVADFRTLCDALPRVEFVDADPLLTRLKLLKEDEEISEIRRTVAIADAGFTAARSLTRPGITDSEIFGAIREVVSSRGARDALVFVSALPYFLSWPQGETLREGDLLTIFIEIVGPTGYWVECGGLLAIGRLEPEQLRVAEASLEAARRAETRLRPGATAGDVAGEIDAVVAENDLQAGLWHGHGVGVDHDAPVITQSDDTPLAAGMVIAVHPNFATADERFGASAVDTYLITEDAPERLSAIPQQILQADWECR